METTGGQDSMDHIITTARYLDKIPLYDSEKPYVMRRKPPLGVPNTNVQMRDFPATAIHDARGHETRFSIRSHGFEFRQWPHAPWSATNGQDSVGTYLEQVKAFLTSAFEADDVRIFDHRVYFPEI